MSTPEGRSRNRYRRAAWTGLTLMTSRVVNIATGLATIPLTLDYLGEEQFGLWMALTSFIGFLNFSDFGLGEGLQNALIQCYGKEDYDTPKRLVSTAATVLGAMFLLITGVSLFVFPWVPWEKVVTLTDPRAQQQLLPTIQAVCIGCGLGLPFTLVQRVTDGYQRGYIGWTLTLTGRILGFAGVLACIWLRLPLWLLSIIYIATPHLILGTGGLILLTKARWLIPSPFSCTRSAFNSIMRVGVASLIIRLGYTLMHNAPPLIVANRIAVSLVGAMSVTQKLVSTVGFIPSSVMSPLRNSYGEAAIRGDWAWVERTLRRILILIVAIYVPVMIVLTLSGRTIVLLWTGDESVVPSWSLLIAYECYITSAAFNAALSGLLYSLNRLRIQAVYFSVWAGLAAGIGYAFAPALGPGGIVWCVAVCEIGLVTSMAIDVKYVLSRRIIKEH